MLFPRRHLGEVEGLPPRLGVLALAVVLAGGCTDPAADVCEAVGDCSQAGSNEWIERCDSEAELLKRECQAVGCGAQYDAYFECAESKYVCNGNVASFTGCENARAQLDAKLAKADGGTGCA